MLQRDGYHVTRCCWRMPRDIRALCADVTLRYAIRGRLHRYGVERYASED